MNYVPSLQSFKHFYFPFVIYNLYQSYSQTNMERENTFPSLSLTLLVYFNLGIHIFFSHFFILYSHCFAYSNQYNVLGNFIIPFYLQHNNTNITGTENKTHFIFFFMFTFKRNCIQE